MLKILPGCSASSSFCLPSPDVCVNWIPFTKDSALHTSSSIQSRFHQARIWTLAYCILRPKIITCCFSAKPCSLWSLLCAGTQSTFCLALEKRTVPKKEPHWLLSWAASVAARGEVFASEFQMTSLRLSQRTHCHQPLIWRPRSPGQLGSILVLESGHYSLYPWNQSRCLQPLTLGASCLGVGMERRLIIFLYVALACGDTCHFLYSEFVLLFKVFFAFMMGILFSFLIKNISISSFPSLCPLAPSPCEHGSPWPQTPAKLLCCLAFL